jgi:hypothetical protein
MHKSIKRRRTVTMTSTVQRRLLYLSTVWTALQYTACLRVTGTYCIDNGNCRPTFQTFYVYLVHLHF